MQNRSKILALSLATIALAACSSMQEKPAYATAQRVNSSTSDVDEAYVATVEIQARRYGADVIWVHPPTKAERRVASND